MERLEHKKVFIQTYGCQMNDHDSQKMMSVVSQMGYKPTEDISSAQLVLLNTCSVRQNPENKVYSLLGRLKKRKMKDSSLIVGVGGCVAQQEGQTILSREKTVDIVFGPDHLFSLPEMIQEARNGRRVLRVHWASRPDNQRVVDFIPKDSLDFQTFSGCRGLVSITKGCDNFCTFCIVPRTRGREVSRPSSSILEEVDLLVSQGAKEILLLGQNVNSYRAGSVDFYTLLESVADRPGVERVRFTSPHPNDWNNRLSDLMADHPHICNQLHIPFQSGSNEILKKMNRVHTIEAYLEKIAYMKSINSQLALTTDLIVGFPSETDLDFEQTLSVIREIKFHQLFSFKYSSRPGTRASYMEDDVPKAIKEERLARVLACQDQIHEEHMEEAQGQCYEVLIDSAHPEERGVMMGRTDGNRPVSVLRSPMSLEIGDMVKIRVQGRRKYTLLACLESE